jgi:hypothetical protein
MYRRELPRLVAMTVGALFMFSGWQSYGHQAEPQTGHKKQFHESWP